MDDLKKTLRKTIKEKKATLTPQETFLRSVRIFEKIEQLPNFLKAKVVLAYWALPGEVQTQDFILKWYQHKNILLPVIDGDTLVLRSFEGTEKMSLPNSLGIAEPIGPNFTALHTIDLAIIPGIAFDRKNNRLGRGKAYYDRLLPHMKTFRLGVCFSFQLYDQIPATEHDIPMDMVLTDE